jgi:hypothetical protein
MNITYNSADNRFFYGMQKEELVAVLQEIKRRTDAYTPSISGICISDQERQTELWQAYANCMFNLNKFN